MEVFDKDGKPVENVFSQEELDAKIKEAKDADAAAAAKAKADADTAAEAAKTKAPEAQKPEDMMAVLKALQETVGSLVKSTESTGASKFTSGLDEEKKTAFNSQFEALQKTGQYENTPEGIEKRAAAAYMLTTGEAFNAGNFDMGNLSGAGGKSVTKANAQQSEVDKQISEALGNTAEDVKKHGDNPTS